MAKKQFKAESKRLLELMIHSIYTNQEIFLRELLSNASDAIDKRYYAARIDENAVLDREEYQIRLETDPEARRLSVIDNGCGMDAGDLESCLGTIAKSGTQAFREQLTEQDEMDIIGKFGVGFYSAFMVADRVVVYSHKVGAEPAVWESTGEDGFTVRPCDFAPIGTRIDLYLKEDTEDVSYSAYLEPYRLSSLVKKYSDYIRYPIVCKMPHSVKNEETDRYETVYEEQTLNSMVPLWRKNKNEITKEEYHTFYRETFYSYEEPVSVLHVRAEGTVSFTALLYLPSKPPFDFYSKDYHRGLKLYSNGVLIMDHCEKLLPEYFGFVQGLVDSPDLSLNISRELLQNDRPLTVIANNLKKKIRDELLRLLKEEREKYETFYQSFGRTLKFGAYDRYGADKDFLKDLLLFHSRIAEKNLSLSEYVEGRKEGQTAIYYAAADSIQKALQLPQTERVKQQGFDILCLDQDVDEFVLRILERYEELPFVSVSDPSLNLSSEEEEKALESKNEEHEALLTSIKEALGDRVASVRLTDRLTDSCVCLVGEEGMSVEMYKVLSAMPNAGEIPMTFHLELNPNHPLFEKLCGVSDGELPMYAELLFDQATLLSGLPLKDPFAFSQNLNRLLL